MRTSGPALSKRVSHGVAAAFMATSIALAAVASPAGAQEAMLVTVDQASVIRLTAPAGTIIIGNPAIADATMVDETTVVITGRSFGTTNLIVLDTSGTIIAEQVITVTSADNQVVVYRQSIRQTYNCTPICAPILNVGDADPAFQTTTQQIQAHAALAQGGN
jgi:Flp pilus assembly secretin CpaC